MRRNVFSFYGENVTQAGEGIYCHAPTWGGFRRDGTQRLLLIDHGHGGTAAAQSSAYLSQNAVMCALARQGWIALAGDNGGVAQWGNDGAMAAKDQHYIFGTGNALQSGLAQLNCLPQVDAMGWSMGGLTCLNWVKRNPTLVRRAVLWAPALQIKTFHDNNSGYGTEIEAAYGGAAVWQANIVGHEPLLEIAAYKTFFAANDISVRIYHGTADATVPIQASRDFVNEVGSDKLKLYELADKNHTDLFGGVNPDDIADFLEGKVAA